MRRSPKKCSNKKVSLKKLRNISVLFKLALENVVLVFKNVGGYLNEEAVELSLVPLGEDVAHLLVAQVTRVLNINSICILGKNQA